MLLSTPEELFSCSVFWGGIVPESTARAQYLTRQRYRKTVLEGVDNNIFNTTHSRHKRKTHPNSI
jgi:hypothetical protein